MEKDLLTITYLFLLPLSPTRLYPNLNLGNTVVCYKKQELLNIRGHLVFTPFCLVNVCCSSF